MRRGLSAAGLVVLLVAVYLLGTFATHFGLFPYPAIRDASQALVVLVNGPPDEPEVAPRELDSIFVRLAVATYEVPAARPGAGGGLTSFGDALVVMPHDGRLFSFENDELRLLPIRVPDNGLDSLMARAETESYAGLEFSFDKFRYNDILYYRDASAHGLVLSFTEWRDADECYGTTVAHLPLPAGITSLTDFAAGPEDWQIAYRT